MAKEALLTVGDVLDALKGFPRDMPIRLAINENEIGDGATAYQLAANVHIWGLLANDIWSDGCDTHRCVNISVIGFDGEKDIRIDHEPKEEFLVKRSEDDPDGEKDYF